MNSSAPHHLLVIAWVSALIGLAGSVISLMKGDARWGAVSRNGSLAAAVTSFISTAGLGVLFFKDDYTNQYVWQYSNLSMSSVYKLCAIWGGPEGSMLLWAMLLSIAAAWLALRRHRIEGALPGCALAAINTSSAFFFTLVLFAANPFRFIRAPFIPPDGNGLNPLLQNPLMAIQPPLLYAGLALQAVPFALAIAALLTADSSPQWMGWARRFALFGWTLLTAAISMGAYWAYLEAGWNGFWAWDPAHTASFLPWLASTAFLHTAMVRERKGSLGLWNLWLAILAFLLGVFSTFLSRAEVLPSVHAFVPTDMDGVFLVYLGAVALVCSVFSFRNGRWFGSKPEYHGMLSKGTALLFNSILLVGLCFSLLSCLLFPMFSGAPADGELAAAVPYLNALSAPLLLGVLLLMGIGPVLAWKGSAPAELLKRLRVPLASGMLAAIAAAVAGIHQVYPLAVLFTGFFSGVAAAGEIRKVWQRRETPGITTGKLLRSSGAHLVHVGAAIIGLSLLASVGFKEGHEFSLERGQTYVVKRHIFQYQDLDGRQTPNYEAVRAEVQLFEEGDQNPRQSLFPEIRGYFKSRKNVSEAALLSSWREDLYLILTGIEENGARASFKLFVNPLQIWLWVGAALAVLGGFLRWLAAGKRLLVLSER